MRKKTEEKLRKAEEKAKRAEEKARAQAERQHIPVSNGRQRASKRAVHSELATVSEGTSASKRARLGDALSENMVSLQQQ